MRHLVGWPFTCFRGGSIQGIDPAWEPRKHATRRRAYCGLLALALALSSGCVDSGKAAVDRQIACFEELADILKSVHDKQTMDDAEDRFVVFRPKAQEASRRLQKLGLSSDEISLRFEREAGRMNEAVRSLKKELERIQQLDGGPQFLKRVNETIGASK